MKRYLAFAGESTREVNLGDLIGDYDDLVMAKHAIAVRDPEGWPIYIQGCVLDTRSGTIRDWDHGTDKFGNPREAL